MPPTRFAAFMADAPTIVVHDALAEFLGAVDDGMIEYRYEDAVRLAGHSCPTVASAFLMARRALRELYANSVPERGGVRVDIRGPREAGVAGVVAAVLGLLTGAGESGAFAGLGGRFRRRDLLAFDAPIDADARVTRIDTGESVDLAARLERVPGDPRMRALMGACLGGGADPREQAAFRALWQDRVRRLLLEHADDPETIVVTRPARARTSG